MSANENFSPAIIKRIAKEVLYLNQKPPEGVKPIINEDNIADVQAWIQGPSGTPYEGGCFKIRLLLGQDYPQAPPKGFFLTKIYHPNISETGEICVNTIKRDWRPNSSIEYVFMSIKTLLYTPNPDSALNDAAAKQYREEEAEFFKRASLLTRIHAVKNQVHYRACPSIAGGGGDGAAATAAEPVSSVKDGRSSPAKAVAKRKTQGVGVAPMEGVEFGGTAVPNAPIAGTKRVADKLLEKQRAEKKRMLRRL